MTLWHAVNSKAVRRQHREQQSVDNNADINCLLCDTESTIVRRPLQVGWWSTDTKSELITCKYQCGHSVFQTWFEREIYFSCSLKSPIDTILWVMKWKHLSLSLAQVLLLPKPNHRLETNLGFWWDSPGLCNAHHPCFINSVFLSVNEMWCRYIR